MPVILLIGITATIPSKNNHSIKNRKFIVVKTNKNRIKSKGSATKLSKCTKMSTIKQFLSLNTVRNDFTAAFNLQIVPPVAIKVKPLINDRPKACQSYFDKEDGCHT